MTDPQADLTGPASTCVTVMCTRIYTTYSVNCIFQITYIHIHTSDEKRHPLRYVPITFQSYIHCVYLRAPMTYLSTRPEKKSQPAAGRIVQKRAVGGRQGGSGVGYVNRDMLECGVCGIRRPPNASHCYECGVCVVELDHHCPVSVCMKYYVCMYVCMYAWLL